MRTNSSSFQFVWFGLLTAPLLLFGCGGDVEQGLPAATGWSIPGDADIPELSDDLTSEDWERMREPVTGRPLAYSGPEDPFTVGDEPPPSGVHVAGDALVFDSEPADGAHRYRPGNPPPLVQIVSADLASDTYRHYPSLITYMENQGEVQISWMARAGDVLFAGFREHIAMMSPSGEWSMSIERDRARDSEPKVGVIQDAFFGIFRRDGDETKKLWRWTPDANWTAVSPTTPSTAKILRHENAGPPTLMMQTTSDELRWSRDLGDSWQTLTVETADGESADLSSLELKNARANASTVHLTRYDFDKQHTVVWASEDLDAWTKQTTDAFDSPHSEFVSAESPTGALLLPHEANLGPSKGVLLSDDGYTRVSPPPVGSKHRFGNKGISDVVYLADRWVVLTPGDLWTSQNPTDGWSHLDLRLAAPLEIDALRDHLVFLQQTRSHVSLPNSDDWQSYNSIERGDSGNLIYPGLIRFFIEGAGHLFGLSSKAGEEIGATQLFYAAIQSDGTTSQRQRLERNEVVEPALVETVVWNGAVTTYVPGSGLFAAQDGLQNWEKVGEPITQEDHGLSVSPGSVHIRVRSLVTFQDRVYALAQSSGDEDAIVRWTEDGDASISIRYVATRARNVDEVAANPSSDFASPVDLHATRDALLAQVNKAPSDDTEFSTNPNGITGKPFIRLDRNSGWQWFLWKNPPRRDILNNPYDADVRIWTSRHAIFLHTAGPELYRYNPANNHWTRLPLPPTIQQMRPRSFGLAPDGSTLYFGGRQGGLYELDLTAGASRGSQ